MKRDDLLNCFFLFPLTAKTTLKILGFISSPSLRNLQFHLNAFFLLIKHRCFTFQQNRGTVKSRFCDFDLKRMFMSRLTPTL